MLYRLGQVCFRHRRWVLVGWLVVLAAVGGAALGWGGWVSQRYDIPGTEADRAQELLVDRFGADAPGIGTDQRTGEGPPVTRIVIGAPADGSLLTGDLEVVLGALAPLPQAAGVVSVSDPIESRAVAPDGSVAYLDVRFADDDVPPATVAQIETAAAGLREAGFTVALTGGPFTEPIRVLSGAELIGVGVALVVLVVTFGSLLAAGIPVGTALIGVGIGAGGILTVAGFADVSSGALALALMLGVAVGIDYGLFLVSRHRQQLSEGVPVAESAARTMATAGNAVVLAAATVIIALVALSVVGIPFLTYIGLAAAAAVTIAVVVALTLVPAAMGFAGDRLTPRGRAGHHAARSRRAQNRWGQAVTRRPAVTVAVCGVLLLGAAIPSLSLRLELPDAGRDPTDQGSRQAYDLLADGFGPGFNGPLLVLVDAAEGDLPAAVAALTEPIPDLAHVGYVTPAVPNDAGDTAVVVVVPTTEPNARETTDLVHQLRDLRPQIEDRTGATILVTGAAAASIDISRQLADALPRFLALVIGLAFLLLMVAFRSLLVPLTATLGFVLAVGGALGATVAVYQWGWLGRWFGVTEPAPLVNFLPIVAVGVMFGLAMDYQVFLVSRMREEFLAGTAARTAVRLGFAHGSRVVLAAALTTISVFTAFVFGGEPLIAPIAFALAAGITLDALVVRMTVIPAVMAWLGRWAWWLPGWLDRLLPELGPADRPELGDLSASRRPATAATHRPVAAPTAAPPTLPGTSTRSPRH